MTTKCGGSGGSGVEVADGLSLSDWRISAYLCSPGRGVKSRSGRAKGAPGHPLFSTPPPPLHSPGIVSVRPLLSLSWHWKWVREEAHLIAVAVNRTGPLVLLFTLFPCLSVQIGASPSSPEIPGTPLLLSHSLPNSLTPTFPFHPGPAQKQPLPKARQSLEGATNDGTPDTTETSLVSTDGESRQKRHRSPGKRSAHNLGKKQ